MTTVAVYARVSSEKQTQRQTIESQLDVLKQRVSNDGHVLLPQDVYADDGASGSTLVRPGLERLRDRISEGGIDLLYVHSPDRLARKYAYQVLLLEEFRARGVTVVFLEGPSGQSAEDELLVQVQGMIAEYERAKIVERGRRGRLFRARQGSVNALGRAPFGYMYRPKADGEPARFQVLLHEAKIVRRVFECLVREQKSIEGIVRELNADGVPCARGGKHWRRSTVRDMLRNPAYMGKAAFGKTRSVQRSTSTSRPPRGHAFVGNRGTDRRPPEEWIFIDVPPIISAELFGAAAEQLDRNRQTSLRRATQGRYLLQGLTVCAQCGYAFYGACAAGKYQYYRCVGADACRFGGKRVCSVSPVRRDMLEEHVWSSVCELLQDPQRLQREWLRRTEVDNTGGALQTKRDEAARLIDSHRKTLKRLLDAYEIGAIQIEELQRRTRAINARIERANCELEQWQKQIDETLYLRAIITRLEDFGARVASRLKTLTWNERQQVVRMLVAKIEIGSDGATIVYRVSSSAPPPKSPPGGPSGSTSTKSYRLRPGEHARCARQEPPRLTGAGADQTPGSVELRRPLRQSRRFSHSNRAVTAPGAELP